MTTRKAFAGIANQNPRPQTFDIIHVNSAALLEQQWEPTLGKIFTDPQDLETKEQLVERQRDGEDFFLLWDTEKRRAAGIELTQILPESGAMYIPWTGVLPEYRNLGIGAAMTHKIATHMRSRYGATHTIIEVEDPVRLRTSDAYAPDELEDAIAVAARRINFWRRQNFVIIDDNTKPVGEKLSYVRPGSADDQLVQAYDHMAVRFHDPALRNRVMTADGRISKAFVRACYFDMNRIQFGKELTDTQLRDNYPAIDQYARAIDAVAGDTLATRNEAIIGKTSPTAKVTLNVVEQQGPAMMTASRPQRRVAGANTHKHP